jgi:hypothetical protein
MLLDTILAPGCQARVTWLRLKHATDINKPLTRCITCRFITLQPKLRIWFEPFLLISHSLKSSSQEDVCHYTFYTHSIIGVPALPANARRTRSIAPQNSKTESSRASTILMMHHFSLIWEKKAFFSHIISDSILFFSRKGPFFPSLHLVCTRLRHLPPLVLCLLQHRILCISTP